jgi:ATP-binding protein involved in chromosome partitioning
VKSYFEIAGDGGSGIAEQVAELRGRVATALSDVRCRLAVGSGKGGVGKSTLTRHLAGALRQRGHRVAVLDADLNGPTQARLAGVQGVPPVPGERGLRLPRSADGVGVLSLGAFVPEGEAVEFDSVARGDSHVWRAAREFTLLAELLGTVEWGELDYLLIDLAPGAERTFQYAEFLGPETAFLLVTIPSELSRGVVARSVAALAGVPNPVLGYVENMSGYYCAECDEVKPMFPIAGEVELPIPCLGRLPFDPELAALCDRGLPSSAGGETLLTRSLAKIADRVALATTTLEKTR